MFSSTQHQKNSNKQHHFSFWNWRKLVQGYLTITVTPPHQSTLKLKAGIFKFLQFEETFRKACFSRRTNVNGRPNRSKKRPRFQVLPAWCWRDRIMVVKENNKSSSKIFSFNYNDFIYLNETPVELFPKMIARLSTSWRKKFFWVVTKREDVSRFAAIDKDQRSKLLFQFNQIILV